MDAIDRKRKLIGIPVGLVHFCLASYLTLSLMASAHMPISRPGDDWILLPFFIVMFPTSILGCVGAFAIPFLPIVLVPITSWMWGIAAARFFVRVYNPVLLELLGELSDGWKVAYFTQNKDGWTARLAKGKTYCRLVSEWGRVQGSVSVDGTERPLEIPHLASVRQIASSIQDHDSELG